MTAHGDDKNAPATHAAGTHDAGKPDAGKSDSGQHDSVQVSHDGQVVATASITGAATSVEPATVTLTARHGDVPPGTRGELVDQAMDHPSVQGSDNVHVVVPLGDTESISRLRERTTNLNARAAGSSSVIDADVTHPDSQS